MAIDLLDFVQNALHAAKQALGKRAGKPESGGLPRETHIVVHCIRKEEGHTFTEIVNRLGLMPDICELLGIHPDALPDPTTFYHSLDRYAMYIWRAFLRVSAQKLHHLDTLLSTARSLNGRKPLSIISSVVDELSKPSKRRR